MPANDVEPSHTKAPNSGSQRNKPANSVKPSYASVAKSGVLGVKSCNVPVIYKEPATVQKVSRTTQTSQDSHDWSGAVDQSATGWRFPENSWAPWTPDTWAVQPPKATKATTEWDSIPGEFDKTEKEIVDERVAKNLAGWPWAAENMPSKLTMIVRVVPSFAF